MGKTKHQYAVIGLGRFGASVAASLHAMGHEVLAIDADEKRVSQISDAVTHVAQADATDETALAVLGLRNFDAVVVAIGGDIQANVATTLLLKEFGVPYIIAKAQNTLHGKMLERIGADRVVYPERDMGQRVAHSMASANFLDYIELSPRLGLMEIAVPAVFVGKTLAQADLRTRYGINVVAIQRQEQLLASLQPAEIMTDGDILFVAGSAAGIRQMALPD